MIANNFHESFEDGKEHPDFPFEQQSLELTSGGFIIHGLIELTTGPGSHPTIIFLHGIPGFEKNMDLSQIFKRLGFNTIIFHYRGSLGSRGTYSFTNCLQDGENVTNHFLLPDDTKIYRIDVTNIFLLGHSMGGFIVMQILAKNPSFDRGIGIVVYNFGTIGRLLSTNPSALEVSLEMLVNFASPIFGTSGQKLVDEIIKNAVVWDLENLAARLNHKEILLVGGKRHLVASIKDHQRLFLAKLGDNASGIEFDSDHQFSNGRINLAENIFN